MIQSSLERIQLVHGFSHQGRVLRHPLEYESNIFAEVLEQFCCRRYSLVDEFIEHVPVYEFIDDCAKVLELKHAGLHLDIVI